jgi:restriction system protein
MSEADCRAVPGAVRRQDIERKKAQRQPIAEELATNETPIGEESWKDRLVAELRRMPPDAFERLSQRILRESGFVKVEITGRSGDGGIDGVGVLRLKLLSFQVLFQCKRYQGTVGAGAVRDFRGAMVGRSDKGLMITTGAFSADAKREATRDGAPPIELIDSDLLCDLIKDLKLGVRVEMVEQVVVDPEWFARV